MLASHSYVRSLNNKVLLKLTVDKTHELLRQIPKKLEGFLLQIKESGEFRALGT